MTDTYMIAGITVRISSVYRNIHALCRDYRFILPPGENAVIDASCGPRDTSEERKAGAENGMRTAGLSDGYVETLAVCRKISERMPFCGRALMHGSAVAADGDGYLFTASSGTGKSTHARLWLWLPGVRTGYVNDDKPFIGLDGGEPFVYGSPWRGKHGLGENVRVPLRAVCFLERGEKNVISPVDQKAAFPEFIRRIYRPFDPGALEATLGLAERIASRVRFYRLRCNTDPEAAQTAYETMTGKKITRN